MSTLIKYLLLTTICCDDFNRCFEVIEVMSTLIFPVCQKLQASVISHLANLASSPISMSEDVFLGIDVNDRLCLFNNVLTVVN